MTSLELWPPREDDGALVPLSEVRNALIEASAGTGKTYQTEGLVVRLVAEEGVSIERILLITFTRAATAELRGRVRGRLSRALRVLAKSEASPTDDEVLLALDALKGARRAEARRRVEVALRNYDRAPISTIHGFCQRVLSEQTLAAGESPEPIVQSEARDLRERLVLDALGSVYANASLELLASLNGQCITLGSLAAVGRVAVAAGHETTDPPSALPPNATLHDLTRHSLQAAERFAEAWTEYRQHVLMWLDGPEGQDALDAVRTITGTTAQAIPGKRELVQRFPADRDALIASLRGWLESEALLDMPNDVEKCIFDLESLWASHNPGRDFASTRLAPLCNQLATPLSTEAGWSMPEFAAWLRAANERACRDASVLTYDAMITRLADRLRLETEAPERPLRAAILARYDAALVDEFQDTDQAQWTILSHTFLTSSDHYLYVVGDPKQAIYRFRGANIGVYLSAIDALDDQFALIQNFRSDPALVDEINAWWTGIARAEPVESPQGEATAPPPGVPSGNTFGDDRIVYDQVEAAHPTRATGLGAPIEMRTFDDIEDKTTEDELAEQLFNISSGVGTTTAAEKRERIVEAVARRVYDFLTDDVARIGQSPTGDGTGGHRIRPRDIAVLCRTRRECRLVREALAERNIRGVTGTSDSLFEGPAAEWLLALIEAIAAPTSDHATRRVALTPLVGWSLRHLVDALEDDAPIGPWSMLRDEVAAWGRRWAEAGFAAMFDHLLRTRGALARLLGRPGGERDATDLRDLAERLHVAERRMRLGPVGLAEWLKREMAAADANDETQLRGIESDADAVVISTVHAAKGLQYPIVLVPFAWSEPQPPPLPHYEPFVYSTDEMDGERVVDLHPPKALERAFAADRAETEEQQESLRLLYVALTRAVHKQVVWYLPPSRNNPWSALDDLVGDRLSQLPCVVDEPPMESPLRRLPDASPPGISLSPWRPVRAPGAGWMVTSYTGLSKLQSAHLNGAATQATEADRVHDDDPDDDLGPAGEAESDVALDETVGTLPADWLAEGGLPQTDLSPAVGQGFAGGTRTGEWLHAVFEHLDFAGPSDALLARDGRPLVQLVEEAGAATGVHDPQQHALAVGLMPGWLDTPLDAAPELQLPAGFCLRQVALRDRADELGFSLRLGSGLDRRPPGGPPPSQLHPEAVRAVYARAVATGARSSDWLRALLTLPNERALLPRIAGLLNGFIDLTFRVGDRYYLCDYKSNLLRGPDALVEAVGRLPLPPDGRAPRALELHYTPPVLAWAMAHSAYHLQALVYTVALHRLLRQRLGAAYHYDRHVGGHLYLFLRGMKGAGSPLGVWADRWSAEVVVGMDAVFSGATAEEVERAMDAVGGTA